jgi:hypothetical protein
MVQRAFLLRRGSSKWFSVTREALLHVAPRLGDAVAEVLQAGGFDPRVVLGPVGEALLVDLGREQFGQRRAHRFLPRTLAAKLM